MFAPRTVQHHTREQTPAHTRQTAEGPTHGPTPTEHVRGSVPFLQRYLGNSSLQSRATGSAAPQESAVPSVVHDVLRSPGQPLDPTTRADMETHFRADFSQVRVHTDTQAAESAQAVGALAYTVGSDIVFGSGAYCPGTPEGRHKIAHELAHALQQGFQSADGLGACSLKADRVPHLEAEAHLAAFAPQPPYLTQGVGLRLQRWEGYEHIALGENAKGPKPDRIILQCFDRDFPGRKQDRSQWPKVWADRYVSFDKRQQDALNYGLTYGEVVALAGDMYAVPGNPVASWEALNNAPLMEILTLLPLLASEKTTSTQLQVATGGRYLALAKQNAEHFSVGKPGSNNKDIYRALHDEAVQAARNGDRNKAWGLNAAADHYLTDAFAGGHIRTPRAQKNPVSSRLQHNIDNVYGVEVSNLRGDRPWIAYGDDKLFESENLKNQVKALEAVRYSKQDIQDALDQGKAYKPPATYKAEFLIPYAINPDANRINLPGGGLPPASPRGQETDTIGGLRRRGQEAVPEMVVKEGLMDAVPSILNEAKQVKDWVTTYEAQLDYQPYDQKKRMIETLLTGLNEDQVRAIETICRHTAADDRRALKKELSLGVLSTHIYFSRINTAFDTP